MSISLEFSFMSYFQLVKISMQLLKLNRDLVDTSDKNDILEPIISTICTDFLWTFESLYLKFTQHYHKIAKLQLKLIEGIWKLYPGSFNGASHLVKTIVDLECRASKENLDDLLCDLKVQMKNILQINHHAPQIYFGFFPQFDHQPEKKLFHLYKLCFEILTESMGDQVLLNIVLLSSDDNSNFCLKLIQSVTENQKLIHSNPELCSEMIMNISQLLYIEGLQEQNLRHFERALVELMIHGKYCTGLFCMHIWLDFLAQIRSKEGLLQYFIFFQAIMNQIWNPATEITTKLQIFISNILQFIVGSHPKITQTRAADTDLIFPFTQNVESKSAMMPFNEVFSSFFASPNAENYYELIKCLKLLSIGGINNVVKNIRFGELLAIDTNFEWSIYSELIINIIDVIIMTKDHQRKMFFLLKFMPFFDCEQSKSFSIQLKLVDLLFSFLPLVECKIGLSELISRELFKLLMSTDSIVTNAVVKRLASEPNAAKLVKNLNFNEHDTKENRSDVIIKSKMVNESHKCVQKKVARVSSEPKTKHSRQLNIILKYSQWIHKQQLQDSDINTLHLIANNFNKTSRS